MNVMDAIRTRRSIRKYEDKPVAEEMVREILDAAMMAPSAGNGQPWRFVVINDRSKLDSMVDLHPHIKMVAQAQLGIIVCADLSLEKYPGYWVQDCAAAMQNMLLAIHSLGLGAVWTGIYPMEDAWPHSRRCSYAEQVIPLGLLHRLACAAAQSRVVQRRSHSLQHF